MTRTTGIHHGLNDHERRLLEWLAAGRTNAQIGLCAGRSEKTIRNQLSAVYAKLGVVNRAEAVAVHLRTVYGQDI
jgi:DNA-binding CsgD family transcriptional regulator